MRTKVLTLKTSGQRALLELVRQCRSSMHFSLIPFTDKADIVDGAPIAIQVSARPCQDEECLAAASIIADVLLEGKPVNRRV